jgi:hypothetical protein
MTWRIGRSSILKYTLWRFSDKCTNPLYQKCESLTPYCRKNNQVLSGGVQSHDFANCLIRNPFLIYERRWEIQPYPDWWISGYVGYAILQPATLIENALAGNQSTRGGRCSSRFTDGGAGKWNWSFTLFRNETWLDNPLLSVFQVDH